MVLKMKYYVEILDWSKHNFVKVRKILGLSINDVEWYTDVNAYAAEVTDNNIELKNILVKFYNECLLAENVPMRFSSHYYIWR